MKNLLHQGKLLLGLNYWSSRDAILMWENWDAEVIEADFAQISQCGITHLRIFPLWPVFQPLCAMRSNFKVIDYRFADGRPLPDTEAGRAGVSEEACEHFAVLCKLAQKYNLKLIIGLITGHMSFRYFAPPAFDGKNPITDLTVLKWELRFIKYFVKRFANEPAIAGWDLGNECNGFLQKTDETLTDNAYVWCSAISDAIRTVDTEHPVITGFDIVPIDRLPFNILDIAETADIHTVHSYNIFQTPNDPLLSMRPILSSSCMCRMYRDVGNTPTFTQEIGSIGYTTCSANTESMFYRALLFSSWVTDSCGVMWWCAYDQEKMDYVPYDWNTIGSQYGFFAGDRAEKPIARECRKFADLMQSLPFDTLPPTKTDAVCILSNNVPTPQQLATTTFSLAMQANLNIGFVHASQKIPKAKIYLMPSIDQRHSITKHRLEEVLREVSEGAVLYLSLGAGLFRELPFITGVEIECREGLTSPELITLGEHKLRVKADYTYHVEGYDAEVLACGEDGRPVYFKHRFGKGYVYFSTVPVEKHLCAQNVTFNKNDGADYAAWYRVFGEYVKDAHVADLSSQMVRITEHPASESTRYAVAINYARTPIDAPLTLTDGWEVSRTLYGDYSDHVVHAKPCDAVILELRRC